MSPVPSPATSARAWPRRLALAAATLALAWATTAGAQVPQKLGGTGRLLDRGVPPTWRSVAVLPVVGPLHSFQSTARPFAELAGLRLRGQSRVAIVAPFAVEGTLRALPADGSGPEGCAPVPAPHLERFGRPRQGPITAVPPDANFDPPAMKALACALAVDGVVVGRIEVTTWSSVATVTLYDGGDGLPRIVARASATGNRGWSGWADATRRASDDLAFALTGLPSPPAPTPEGPDTGGGTP